MSFFPVEFTFCQATVALQEVDAWPGKSQGFFNGEMAIALGLNDCNPNTMIIMIRVAKYHI